MKRVITLSDRHTGHVSSVLPPRYHLGKDHPLGKLQRDLWNRWLKFVDTYKEPDVLLDLGDMIEGKNLKSGAAEVLITDRQEQASVSAEVLAMMKPKKVIACYGTPYHTGIDEDIEDLVIGGLQGLGFAAEIHSCPFVQVEDVNFHIKHKIGGSSIPYGSHTAPARDAVYLELQTLYEDWPDANIILRGHTHQYSYCGNSQHLAMVLPALKAAHDKYGARQVSRHVDFGLVQWLIEKDKYTFDADLVSLKTTRPCLVIA